MTQTAFFGVDEPIAAWALPTVSTDLSWYNVQRQRLRKFARDYAAVAPAPVEVLRSQGEPDVTIPEVADSRSGFTQLRRDLAVMDQYVEYSGDAAVLARVKEVCLAWVRSNRPDGKPINESNFEGLVRVLKRRRSDFSAGERADATAWLQALRAAKEAFDFQPGAGEGTVAHGNWYTHHYKVLLLTLDALGDAAGVAALLAEIDGFAARNFPFGNAAIAAPLSAAVLSANQAGGYFDIGGNHVARFPAGSSFRIAGNSRGNDGSYVVAAASYLSTSGRTRLGTTTVPLPGSGGGGTLSEPFDPVRHDMPRAATQAGESIDYIRRDALHYQVYDLAPWIEIGLSTGSRYAARIDAGFAFFRDRLLSPVRHYEFSASSDPFDALRWQASHPEYLAPEAMFKPQRAAGMILSYFAWRRSLGAYAEPADLLAVALRGTDTIASFWPQYFRWALGYGRNA